MTVLASSPGCGDESNSSGRNPGPAKTRKQSSAKQTAGQDAERREEGRGTQPPLAVRLAKAAERLETSLHDNRRLLIEWRADLDDFGKELSKGIRTSGLPVEEAVSRLEQGDPQPDGIAELEPIYRRCGELAMRVAELNGQCKRDETLIEKLRDGVRRLAEQEAIKTALAPSEREEAESLLEEALPSISRRPGKIPAHPEDAFDMHQAYSQVEQTLIRHEKILPVRTEESLDDLPLLPTLDYHTAQLAEQVVRDSLQKKLESGRTTAEERFADGQAESAILALYEVVSQVRDELDAYHEPLSWKRVCIAELDEFVFACSEQLAEPYVDAIEQALKGEDWAAALDLLDELTTLAPRARKLQYIAGELNALRDWWLKRAEGGDVDAGVAHRRFESLRTKIPGGFVGDDGLGPPRLPSPEISLAGWEFTNARLVEASRQYMEERVKLAELKKDYKPDAPHVRYQEELIDRRVESVQNALADRDREEHVLFEKYEGLIQQLEERYRDFIHVQGMQETAPEPGLVRDRIEVFRSEQRIYEGGRQRFLGLQQQEVDDFAETASFGGTHPGEQKKLTWDGGRVAMRWCPPGAVTLCSDDEESNEGAVRQPVYSTIPAGYWMAEVEVTQGLWKAVMRTTIEQQTEKSYYQKPRGTDPRLPMYNVSFMEAQAFCRRLSDLLRAAQQLPSAWEIDLPTEAQFQHACAAWRRGDAAERGQRFPFGDDEQFLGEFAWYRDNSAMAPHFVKTRKPNQWGLHDMIGNVEEWCRLVSGFSSTDGDDSATDKANAKLPIRGGSWAQHAEGCRVGVRDRQPLTYRGSTVGFRFVAVPSPNRSKKREAK